MKLSMYVFNFRFYITTGPSNDYTHMSSSSCCRKKTSSSSKNSNRKGCKCGSNPNSSKENTAHSPPSSSKSKKGNWAGLKFNCAKLKNSNVKPNNSFSSTSSDFPMEQSRGKVISIILNLYIELKF